MNYARRDQYSAEQILAYEGSDGFVLVLSSCCGDIVIDKEPSWLFLNFLVGSWALVFMCSLPSCEAWCVQQACCDGKKPNGPSFCVDLTVHWDTNDAPLLKCYLTIRVVHLILLNNHLTIITFF